ncbi:unnamed protein product [Adineta steineri]|uniref:UMOD/GP2/OIT3-like D8C domain-containing protein n=1 Tax=Adineta steineri TaxID=433720 RepID=A0A814TJF1_9BILA|nr:unnamed protein product [Adineta steineri]CAF1300492.1 unnamed protein product [Adineta steineri]
MSYYNPMLQPLAPVQTVYLNQLTAPTYIPQPVPRINAMWTYSQDIPPPSLIQNFSQQIEIQPIEDVPEAQSEISFAIPQTAAEEEDDLNNSICRLWYWRVALAFLLCIFLGLAVGVPFIALQQQQQQQQVVPVQLQRLVQRVLPQLLQLPLQQPELPQPPLPPLLHQLPQLPLQQVELPQLRQLPPLLPLQQAELQRRLVHRQQQVQQVRIFISFNFKESIFFCYNLFFVATSSALPPQCSTATIITDATRKATNTVFASLCDQSSGLSGTGWYRFSGGAGTILANYVVPVNQCGTQATGSYTGAYPSTAGSTSSGTVCYNWSGNSCMWSNSISITNCNGYYVFYLPTPPVCSLRYCTI